MALSPVPELVAELAAGRMVILVDEEDRENEGDLVLAADHVTPETINFMAKHRPRPDLPDADQATAANACSCRRWLHATARCTAPPSPCRSRRPPASPPASARPTVPARCRPPWRGRQPTDLVQPGHIFPLQAQDGGVLMRAGHTEAGCDLAAMAG
jgi:3,4-dihydroxy 2-butanone 4-phosphate synthase/GTP cyclohydrolase II